MSTNLTNQKFQFRYVKNGDAAGFGTGKGVVTENGLMLGKEELPFNNIGDTFNRDSRLVLMIDPTNLHEKIVKYQTDGVLVLEINKPGTELIKRVVDHKVSKRRADATKRRITQMGTPDQLRQETCGHCKSIIDASEKPRSTYLYCPYCDNVLRQDATSREYVPALDSPGATMRICDNCGMFGRIKGYTEFYFYFLVVVYGYRYKRIHVCDTCADRTFWKNFLINTIFILGIGPALWLKVRSSMGRTEDWKNLTKANKLATKGKVQEAQPLYDALTAKFADHPGLLLDKAMAHTFAGDFSSARDLGKRALNSCSNYIPAENFLVALEQAAAGAPSGPAAPIASPQMRTENPLTTHV